MLSMRGTSVSVFGEPDEYLAALSEMGYRELLVTQREGFCSSRTVIALRSVRLSSVEERSPRIATLALAQGLLRIVLPPQRGVIVCNGIDVGQGQLVTHGAGHKIHERVAGSTRWRDIVVSGRHFAEFSRALTGTTITIPRTVQRWHPPKRALRSLTALHEAATRMTNTHPREAYEKEAAHGLEQELTDLLVACLAPETARVDQASAQRNARIIDGLNRMIESCPEEFPSMAVVCRKLGIADRTLRRVCDLCLGISPTGYCRLRRMQLVRRALRNAVPGKVTVTQLARQHGFHEPGRFATSYQKFFGELPSTTLRH